MISSDVWWRPSVGRKSGFKTSSPFARHIYSWQYIEALQNSDLVIHPPIPATGIVPGLFGMRSLIRSGEAAAEKVLARWEAAIAAAD